MKENLIDILVYVFEQYLVEQPDGFADLDNIDLAEKLLGVGFEKEQIDQAFVWLEGLISGVSEKVKTTQRVSSYRVFSREEKAVIPFEAQSLIRRLEQSGVLDTSSRELIIDRVFDLKMSTIDIDDVRWVIMMVLCNQTDFPEEMAWAESLVSETPTNIQ